MDRAKAEEIVRLALNIAKELSPGMTTESNEALILALTTPVLETATLCFRPQGEACPWRVRVAKAARK